MRRLVLGDIHGAYAALKQVLKRADVDYENDKIIFVGDLCDGWFHTKEVIDELMKIKNLVFVYGNHDEWLRNYFNNKVPDKIWLKRGGDVTEKQMRKYINTKKYINFMNSGVYYHIEDDNKLFVHGGLESFTKDIEKQLPDLLMWDRQVWEAACFAEYYDYPLQGNTWKEIWIGHTSTRYVMYDKEAHGDKPMHCKGVWNVDTGAGWGGKLTIMDIDTKEYWQSDLVKELYPLDHYERLKEAGFRR